MSPVSLAIFVQHARGRDAAEAESALITDYYMPAAVEWVERYTGRALITQTWTYTLDAPPDSAAAILLPRVPLIGVSSIVSYNASDVLATMSPVTDYDVDTASEPGRVVLRSGIGWPTDLRTYGSVVVTYTAGYGDTAEDVPPLLQLAVLHLATYWYDHREDSSETEPIYAPFGVRQILDNFKVGSVLA